MTYEDLIKEGIITMGLTGVEASRQTMTSSENYHSIMGPVIF